MKTNEVKRILRKAGCYLKLEKSNHEWWYSPITKASFPIERHGAKEMAKGTLKIIEKQSEVKF